MATYKEIKGVTVQTLDEDPVVREAVWSSGGALNTARQTKGVLQELKLQSLFLVVRPAPGLANAHEQYNGTAWTETTEINTDKKYANAGAGTYILCFCQGQSYTTS